MSWLGQIQIDVLGDHLCTCITHSGTKKAHDWVVDQLTDLFHTTHTVKTQNVTKNRGRHCGDVELTAYLPNAEDPGVFGTTSPHRPRFLGVWSLSDQNGGQTDLGALLGLSLVDVRRFMPCELAENRFV